MKVIQRVKFWIARYIYGYINNKKKNKSTINIATIEETLQKIIDDKVSVSRFGDGEFKWMQGYTIKNSFQTSSTELSRRLKEVLNDELEGHIVCLPDMFGDLSKYVPNAQAFWSHFMVLYRDEWIGCLNLDRQYYNTNITRCYMDYVDKEKCKTYFDMFKQIWKNRDIVIVEGEKSRLGIGNDLFINANQIERILAPSINAFEKYNEILREVTKLDKTKLILIALGPTATVLAYDLAKLGYQAIDTGHLDIEYEWYLRGCMTKIPIKNKYVNEAGNAGRNVEEFNDFDYGSDRIICKIT